MARQSKTRWQASYVLVGLMALAHPGPIVGVSSHHAEPASSAPDLQGCVVADEGGNAWTIGNNNIALRLGRGSSGGVTVLALDSPATGARWDPSQLPDQTFFSGANRLTPGQGAFAFRSARTDDAAGGVRLALEFEDPANRIRVTRFYACSPTAAALETWSTFEAIGMGAAIPVSDLGVWQMTVPAREVGWITGLTESNRFTIQHEKLASQGSFQLGSMDRSTTSALPVMWLAGPAGHFFSGLMWSGAWSVTVEGPNPAGRVAVRWTPGGTATTVRSGQPLETPHAFFGIAESTTADVTLALRTFIGEGVRHGRPLTPLVTYNTWFAYGIDIDEARLRAEVDHAAALGVELFVVDAGWYVGGTEISDFTTGLGAWTADVDRFPSGLRALADYTRSRGMKFGIWVEPERVDTRLLTRSGIVRERALATTGGRYNPGVKNASATAAQICLADAEGRRWALEQLVRLIDEVRPDYLKWDNNYWINCDRAGHGHDALDGNFAHVTGLYGLLADLRERYPDLIIENCSGGGHRLDFGMLRYADVGWMDDTTAPSAHVRHNLEGLGAVFPPAYLLSFVIDHRDERIHGGADLPAYFRSRMAGILGLTLRGEEFGEEDIRQMAREVALAKWIRAAVPDAALVGLTGQVDAAGSDAWDVIQLVSPSTGTTVLLTFAGPGAAESILLRVVEFDPDARYVINTPDGGHLGDATGEALMEDGIRVSRSASSASEILLLTKEVQTGAGIR